MKRFSQSRWMLLIGFLSLVILTAMLGQRISAQKQSPLTGVIEETRTGGGSGVHTWAERMGISTLALRSPIDEIASELPSTGNCLITAGNRAWLSQGGEFSETNWSPLRKWISAGNCLIVITSESDDLPTSIREHFAPDSPDDQPELTGNQPPRPTFLQPEWEPFAVRKQEFQEVPTRWGGSLSVQSTGPRLANLPADVCYAGHPNSTVLAGKPLDSGMIYLLLDSSAWVNEAFDRADNAATLSRVLRDQLQGDGVLAFDEYRHGYGRIESFTTLFFSLPGAKSFTLMAVVWGLFWLWGATRRLSPPDEFHEHERRTALEYIESVAALNQRARAAPLAVQSVLQRVQSLVQKRGIANAKAQSLFRRATLMIGLEGRPSVPQREMKLVAEIIQLRKELYGTREGS